MGKFRRQAVGGPAALIAAAQESQYDFRVSVYACSIIVPEHVGKRDCLASGISIGDAIELRRDPPFDLLVAYHDNWKVGYLARDSKLLWNVIKDRPYHLIVVGIISDEAGILTGLDVEITIGELTPKAQSPKLIVAIAALIVLLTPIAASERIGLHRWIVSVTGGSYSQQATAGSEVANLKQLTTEVEEPARKEANELWHKANQLAAHRLIELQKRQTAELAAQQAARETRQNDLAWRELNSRELIQYRQRMAVWNLTEQPIADSRARIKPSMPSPAAEIETRHTSLLNMKVNGNISVSSPTKLRKKKTVEPALTIRKKNFGRPYGWVSRNAGDRRIYRIE